MGKEVTDHISVTSFLSPNGTVGHKLKIKGEMHMLNAQMIGLMLISFGAGSLLCACMSAATIRVLIGVLAVTIGLILLKRCCH